MSRFDQKSHWALYDGKNCRSRCKMTNCIFFSHWFCNKCQKHLCITSKRNCFFAYHHETADGNEMSGRRKCDQPRSSQNTKNQQGNKKINNATAAKKSVERRRSSVQTASIGCSPQSRNIKKMPKQTAVASKQLIRELGVNVTVDEKCDSSRDEEKGVRIQSKVKFLSALSLCMKAK